jgi:hypothetical protein
LADTLEAEEVLFIPTVDSSALRSEINKTNISRLGSSPQVIPSKSSSTISILLLKYVLKLKLITG